MAWIMKAPLLAAFLVAVLILGLAGSISFSKAQTPTLVSGIISSDTTWTKANSPYNLTGPVAVNSGVTLTVEAGAAINLGSYYIQVNGTFIAKGTSSSLITVNGGNNNYPNYGITFSTISNSWNEQTKIGSIIENAILSSTYLNLNSSPKISSNTIKGAIISKASPVVANNTISGFINIGSATAVLNNKINGYIVIGTSGSPSISSNIINGAPGTDWVGRPSYLSHGIYSDVSNDAYISDNTITGMFDQAAISLSAGNPTILKNSISNTYGYNLNGDYHQAGISIGKGVNALIQNNTITHNAVGIQSGSASLTLHYNNIQDNSNYNIYLTSTAANNVNATYNWWGTTSTQAVNQTIYGFKKDFNLGTVNFTPFLTEPNPQAAPDINAPTPTPTQTAQPTPSPTISPAQSATPNQPSTPPTTSPPSLTASPMATPTLEPPSISPTVLSTPNPSSSLSAQPSQQLTQAPLTSISPQVTMTALPAELTIAAVAILVIVALAVGFLLGRRTRYSSSG